MGNSCLDGMAETCEDLARGVVFPASEYNWYITGATLDINGDTYMIKRPENTKNTLDSIKMYAIILYYI